MKIEWKCPYCGLLNKIWEPFKKDAIQNSISMTSYVLSCDLEEQGCGRRAVVDFFASVSSVSHQVADEVANAEPTAQPESEPKPANEQAERPAKHAATEEKC